MKPFLAPLCLLGASLAVAGQSRPKEMNLDQVVEAASLVVVVVRDTPSLAGRSVDLGSGRKPFQYGIRRFRVLETLRGSLEPAEVKTLQTVGRDVGTLLQIERNQLSKTFFSPYFPPGEGLLDKRDTLILFLHGLNDRGEHPFVAENACVPVSQKRRIVELLPRNP